MSTTWTIEDRELPAVAVTRGPKQHFFGYYDKSPFDYSQRYLLALECDVLDRLQRPTDVGVLGMVDLEQDCQWTPLAETRAWNWQMGCTSLWLPGPGRRIVYNDYRDGELCAVLLDIDGGQECVLPRPVFTLSPDGRTALSLNFARLWEVKVETGYCVVDDPWTGQTAPPEDGIFSMDLETGESSLIVSHQDLARHERVDAAEGVLHFFSHMAFNSDGSRFLFWYRCNRAAPQSFYTVNADGTDLYRLGDRNSHSVWLGQDRILAWVYGESGRGFYLFHDRTGEPEIVAPEVLNTNSHASFSPDGNWILADQRPPQVSGGSLRLLNMRERRCFSVGNFPGLPQLKGPLRCDLHPRWSADGSLVCIDSTHKGSRQVYVTDVSEIVRGTGSS